MGPQWYFSCEELANYMKLAVRKAWDTREIGMKVEAFAIAGCDAISMYFNGKHSLLCSNASKICAAALKIRPIF
jgi:hypothetical protein